MFLREATLPLRRRWRRPRRWRGHDLLVVLLFDSNIVLVGEV
jgi:hypothetical protein